MMNANISVHIFRNFLHKTKYVAYVLANPVITLHVLINKKQQPVFSL